MFNLPSPDLQINFALLMRQIRKSLLQDALVDTVRRLAIPELDLELATLVPRDALSTLAGHGLRAEAVFPAPILLMANPKLLGYYRLLYGYSQKEFYGSRTGLSSFRAMEERGTLSSVNQTRLADLCTALCRTGSLLLSGISGITLDSRALDELTLLTLGPQLRGGANVLRGIAGIQVVFNVIRRITGSSIQEATENRITIRNAAGRKVLIEFAQDPDITLQVEMTSEFRKLIAIEVKAGSDFSNIHNRLGEAEKSHQKARHAGYAECWTVVNVSPFDSAKAFRASPSTNRFYRIADLIDESTSEFQDFRDRIVSLTGI